MQKNNYANWRMPVSRTENIVVQEINDEILVYDLKTNKAHNLNSTMALIWQKCDGKTSLHEVITILMKKLEVEIDEDFIWLAIKELDKTNLLLGEMLLANKASVSRRKVLFKYALPTLAMPVVLSLVAPTTVEAQSCVMLQGTCSGAGAGNCCPGIDACQSSVCCNGVGSPCATNADCCGFFSCDGVQCL